MTNGVTPRRWVHCANPALSAIFTKYLGSHERLGGTERQRRLLFRLGGIGGGTTPLGGR